MTIENARTGETMKMKIENAEVFAQWRDQLQREWLAWRQVCKQLAQVGVNINDHEALACAIRLWGEEVVALREENPEHTEKARTEHREAYEKHVLDGWAP